MLRLLTSLFQTTDSERFTMKKLRIISLVIAVVTVLLSSCRAKPFEPVEVVTTTTTTTQAAVQPLSKFDFKGARFGMTVENTQKTLGQWGTLEVSNGGLPYFILEMTDLDFLGAGYSTYLYFIYTSTGFLCEMQYTCATNKGFNLDEAVKTYNDRYGKHAEAEAKDGKKNYIWFSDDAYIVITTTKSTSVAISFFDKSYFETNYSDEVNAYNNAK